MAKRFADVFLDPADDPRADPPGAADERTLLTGFLRWQRQTLEVKCGGLDAAALAARPVPFCTMSLLGLVRHLADVERFWFREVLAGESAPRHYGSPDARDEDFDGAVADPAVVDEAWATWRAEVEWAERYAAATDLDHTAATPRGGAVSLRWVLLHMVEEYARHAGHADLLRQGVDGRVGQ